MTLTSANYQTLLILQITVKDFWCDMPCVLLCHSFDSSEQLLIFALWKPISCQHRNSLYFFNALLPLLARYILELLVTGTPDSTANFHSCTNFKKNESYFHINRIYKQPYRPLQTKSMPSIESRFINFDSIAVVLLDSILIFIENFFFYAERWLKEKHGRGYNHILHPFWHNRKRGDLKISPKSVARLKFGQTRERF